MMKNIKNYKFLVFFTIVVLFVLIVWGIIVITSKASVFSWDLSFYKIEIRNGNTGVQYSLEGSQARSLFSELSEVRLETVGINNLALGYNYSIEYVSPNKSKTIIVKSNNQIVRGMFRYKTDVDVIRLVERYLTE